MTDLPNLQFRQYLENDEEKYDSIQADIPMPRPVYILSELFSKHGKSLFAVGGAVRDYLMHKFHDPNGKYAPKDVDVATDAQPKEVLAILNSHEARVQGIKAFPKGESFGVISAVVDGEEYEIATFREEWYDPDQGDGRRPDQVTFSTPGKDAQRRDLTMNALFYDIHNKEIRDYNLDPQGRGLGLTDIRNQVARPVGNARDRFREDKLRIPRLIRFFSRFNPGDIRQHLDQDVLNAIEEFKDLAGVSPERTAAEFLAGLKHAQSPAAYLGNYQVLGLLPILFPKLKVGNIQQIGQARNPKAVLAWILMGNNPKTVRAELNAQKYSSDVFDSVAWLVDLFQNHPERIRSFLIARDIWKQQKTPELQQNRKLEIEKDVRDLAAIAGRGDMEHFLEYEPTVRFDQQKYGHLKGPAITKTMDDEEAANYRKSSGN